MEDVPEASPQSPVPTGAENAVRLVIPLATALVLGVLLALGIEGDVRSRLIRNEPQRVFWAFALVMAGLSIPLLLQPMLTSVRFPLKWIHPQLSRPRAAIREHLGGGDTPPKSKLRELGRRTAPSERPWPSVLGGILVLSGALLAVYTGARDIGEREQPNLSMAAHLVDEQSQMVDVVVSSTGLSLRSDDKMLLRVVAVQPGAQAFVGPLCSSNSPPGYELDSLSPENRSSLDSVQEPVRVLYWGESAATAAGTTAATITVRVPRPLFSHVCAYAALSNKSSDLTQQPSERRREERLATSIVDIRNVAGTSRTGGPDAP